MFSCVWNNSTDCILFGPTETIKRGILILVSLKVDKRIAGTEDREVVEVRVDGNKMDRRLCTSVSFSFILKLNCSCNGKPHDVCVCTAGFRRTCSGIFWLSFISCLNFFWSSASFLRFSAIFSPASRRRRSFCSFCLAVSMLEGIKRESRWVRWDETLVFF